MTTPAPAYLEHPTNQVIAAINTGAARFFDGKTFEEFEDLEEALQSVGPGSAAGYVVQEVGGWRLASSPVGTVDFQIRPERGTWITYLDKQAVVTAWVGEHTWVQTSKGGDTDEGYDLTHTSYRWCNVRGAEMETSRDALDCDGPIRYSREYVASGTTPWRKYPTVMLTNWVLAR